MSLRNEVKKKFSPVIVRVKENDYVPKGMTVTMRMSPTFFTARCESWEALEAARMDPKVHAIQVG